MGKFSFADSHRGGGGRQKQMFGWPKSLQRQIKELYVIYFVCHLSK